MDDFPDQHLYRKQRGGSFFMRWVKPEIHDIQERKNKHYYMLLVKRPNKRNITCYM